MQNSTVLEIAYKLIDESWLPYSMHRLQYTIKCVCITNNFFIFLWNLPFNRSQLLTVDLDAISLHCNVCHVRWLLVFELPKASSHPSACLSFNKPSSLYPLPRLCFVSPSVFHSTSTVKRHTTSNGFILSNFVGSCHSSSNLRKLHRSITTQSQRPLCTLNGRLGAWLVPDKETHNQSCTSSVGFASVAECWSCLALSGHTSLSRVEHRPDNMVQGNNHTLGVDFLRGYPFTVNPVFIFG